MSVLPAYDGSLTAPFTFKNFNTLYFIRANVANLMCPAAENIMEPLSRSLNMHISFQLLNLMRCHLCFKLCKKISWRFRRENWNLLSETCWYNDHFIEKFWNKSFLSFIFNLFFLFCLLYLIFFFLILSLIFHTVFNHFFIT